MLKLVFWYIFNTLILSTLVQSWDIAVGVDNQIQFFNENGSKAGIVSQQFEDVRTMAYDSLNQTLYFVDNLHDNVSIFSIHIGGKRNIEHVVKKNINHRVLGITVDPVSEKLFWTVESNDSIFWMSLRSGSNSTGTGEVFKKLEGESPEHIVVDSCRGVIYWTNVKNGVPIIESMFINGKNHQVIAKGNMTKLKGITLHQGMKKIFWSDISKKFKIEGADLDGGNRKVYYDGNYRMPYHIAASKKAIYGTDWAYNKVWMLPLENTSQILEFKSFGYDAPTGIIVNDDLLEQTDNVPECSHLHEIIMKRLQVPKDPETDDGIVFNVDVPQYVLEYCKDIDESNSTIKCKNGVSRYPYMLCYNHCFRGSCFLDNDNLPKCRCHNGFSGDRCQNDDCYDRCLNNGTCLVNSLGLTTCECSANWTGDRCEISRSSLFRCASDKNTNTSNMESKIRKSITERIRYSSEFESSKSLETTTDSVETRTIFRLGGGSRLNPEQNKSDGIATLQQSDESELFKIIEETSEKNMNMMSETQYLTIIICLALLCIVFLTSTIILYLKVITLKKRPRINKRFVVNKNVTPLTSRPQCEVTIENCCNMNICETPCFEPSDLLEHVEEVSKKEEKKNLLLNMQHSEDTY